MEVGDVAWFGGELESLVFEGEVLLAESATAFSVDKEQEISLIIDFYHDGYKKNNKEHGKLINLMSITFPLFLLLLPLTFEVRPDLLRLVLQYFHVFVQSFLVFLLLNVYFLRFMLFCLYLRHLLHHLLRFNLAIPRDHFDSFSEKVQIKCKLFDSVFAEMGDEHYFFLILHRLKFLQREVFALFVYPFRLLWEDKDLLFFSVLVVIPVDHVLYHVQDVLVESNH